MSARALPAAEGPSGFFWTGGRDGVLAVRWCDLCTRHLHPSLEVCPACGSTDLGERAVSGEGTVVAFSVIEHTFLPSMPAPYVVVVVALREDPRVRLTSNLVGTPAARVTVGMTVAVTFEQHQDVWIPLFAEAGLDLPPVEVEEPDVRSRPPASRRHFEHAVALTGVGASQVGRRLRRTSLSLSVEACRSAISDAGLTPADIDGLACFPGSEGMPGLGSGGIRELERNLALRPIWHAGAQETAGQLGGIVNAMLAVAAGLCRHVLCWTVVSNDNRPGLRSGAGERITGEPQWHLPYGSVSPATWVGLAASQYMHRYHADSAGAAREALGWIAVSARRHAAGNPEALYADPLELDDYYAARPISTPFGLYDCDVPCDGAVAVVVSAAGTARYLRHPPVLVEASGTRITEVQSWDQGSLTHQTGVFGPAAHLWERSSLTCADVDVACLYDGFTFNVVTWLEALGFCGLGEAPDFVKGAERIGPGGTLPLNPHGGQLSAGRSNGHGGLREAILQLRGAAGGRQVPGAEVALVSAGGGIPAGCLLLTTDR